MTPCDFFTLNELENGLTTPDRVNELITVLQSEKDSGVNSFGQTPRQWSNVATAIAATQNKNCLDLFIQLDGLFFIDRWLKDAQKLEEDNENGFLEELIISLFRALEKLQIDNERLFSSGIIKTVQDFVANSNSMVCEKAKELCDNWVLIQDKNKNPQDVKNLDNVEARPPDNSMDSETKNQEPLDRVDQSSKSMDDNNGDSNSKSEGVGKSGVKDQNVINFQDKTELMEMSTLSSPLEQIASSADVDNPLESSIKTDVLSDKDDDMADDGVSPKTSSNSDSDDEAGNTNGGVQNNENSENGSLSFKLSINNKKSDMELDYGMVDPLDIARQVANEVEREVDSRERSCSTSEKTPSGGIERPNTSDSKNGQEIQSQSQPVVGSDKEVLPEPVKDAETLVSQISEVAQESEPDTGRRFSGIDLNQEVCSEEVDNPANQVNSTFSVVSASQAAARLPAGLLQFEGTQGWKGSTSTSALQAVLEPARIHSSSNQRLDLLDFDLNVAEGGEEDKMVIIPGLPSGEESSVANPRKHERVHLDLNSIGDEQNGWQSPHHPSSSSSSSSKQSNLRKNIDLNLNVQPIFPKGEDSVISIFGAKVEVKRNDYVPQSEPKFDFNYGKPLESSMHYGHHNGMFLSMPMFGSSSHAMHMPIPMPMPMPYMVDSRGIPFVPQIMGSQPPSPFIMNMAAAGVPSGSKGLEPPQHNFDLNTGLMINGGLRQFFPQNGDEQASSSSVLGKRHEADSRFEFLPVKKHQQPPWR